MKRKIFSILFALVLVVSFSLVTAVPAAAATTYNVVPYTLSTGTNAAAWSTVQKATGSYSVLLNYVSGDNSYVEFTPATGTTVDDLATIADGWSWWYYASAAYGPILELRFSAPGSGHVDITVDTAEVSPVITTGTTEEVTSTSTCIYFGNDDTDQTSFSDNTGSVTLAGVLASINAQQALLDHTETATAWELTRVRAEIGWSTPVRTCYIDDIEINSVTYYGSIQDAIDVAVASDTITVAAGTYAEEITVDKNLTITCTATCTINGDVHFDASSITMTDATLGATYEWYIDSDTASIQDAVDSASVDDTINVAAGEYNEQVAIPSGKDGLTLEGNSATDTIIQAPSGIITTINVASPTVTIREFWIKAPLGTAQQAVISLGAGAVSTSGNEGVIEDNKIEGVVPTGAFANIVLLEATDYWEIKDNEFVGGKSSIAFNGADYILVSGNTLSDGGVGSTENSDNVTISDNQFLDAGIGIATSATNLTIVRNTITGADSGIKIWGDAAISTVVVRYNSISGNINYGIEGSSNATATLDAKYNYWGDPSGPTITATNPRGAGDAVTTYVTYEPWLHTTQATVVAANTRYYAYNLVSLQQGWNIWSTPIALDEQAATWGNYKALGVDLALTNIADGPNAYYFNNDGSTQSWAQPGADYVLKPCDAIYVKMASAQVSPILFSPDVSAPSKMLYPGWNLVSASYIDNLTTPDLTAVAVETALASVYYAIGASNIGYSVVTSPAVNQTAWSGVRKAAIDTSFGQTMIPTEGYWVHMVNGGILVGAVFTPVSPLIDGP